MVKLNPIIVEKLCDRNQSRKCVKLFKRQPAPISVGGGRFNMGGQTAGPDGCHISLRGMNRVLDFSTKEKWIRVQAGIRWCDIQHFVDPHNLSVKIMQSHASFTVGGAFERVNASMADVTWDLVR